MASKTYPFTDPAYYIYDPSKIEIAGGVAKLRRSFLDVYANWHLNESSGSIAADSSGNGRDGALFNMENEDWKAGKLNNCLEFDGGNEEINLGDIANFERTDPFSVELWFKTGTNNQDIINRMMAVAPYTGWGLWMDAGGKIQFFLVNSISSNNYILIHITANYSDSNWHHLIVTYDGSSSAAGIHVYLDGNNNAFVIDSDSLTGSIQNTVDCRIAARDRAAYHFEGQIDEVVIYEKELNQAEVTARWNSGDGIEEVSGGDYPIDKPSIKPLASWQASGLTKLIAFTEALGGGNQGSTGYQISGDDGESWLYWNGTAWVIAGAGDYNNPATIHANIDSFLIVEDRIIFKAFLISNGSQQVEIDSIGMTAIKLVDILQAVRDETDKIQPEIVNKKSEFKADVEGMALEATVQLIKTETDKIQGEILDKKDEFKADIAGNFAPPNEYDAELVALQTALDNPDQFKADVTALVTILQTIISNIAAIKVETHFLKVIAGGTWEIKNNQMIFYEENSSVELLRFNLLDKAGNPAERNVYKRTLPT